jgi:hypothetical protein
MDKVVAIKITMAIGFVVISTAAGWIGVSLTRKATISFSEIQGILVDLGVKLSTCNSSGVFLYSNSVARGSHLLDSEDEMRHELTKARVQIVCHGKPNTAPYNPKMLLKNQWVKMPAIEHEDVESDCYAQKNLVFCIYTSDASPLQLDFRDGIGLAELQ